jgi:ketosteroid isomerase-like protein
MTFAPHAEMENAMTLELPKPVADYLAADKAKDFDLLASCFADDALVHDEERDYRGVDAIKAWKQQADAKYNYVAEPLDASVNDDTVKLRTRLTGDFPGSPIEVDYTFTLANDKITSLAIR